MVLGRVKTMEWEKGRSGEEQDGIDGYNIQGRRARRQIGTELRSELDPLTTSEVFALESSFGRDALSRIVYKHFLQITRVSSEFEKVVWRRRRRRAPQAILHSPV